MRSENDYLTRIRTFQDKRIQSNPENKNFLKTKSEG